MINQELVDYIKSVKNQGYETSAIFEALEGSGWSDKDINEALDFITRASHMPLGEQPSLKTYHYVPEGLTKTEDVKLPDPKTLPQSLYRFSKKDR